ncbi:Glucan synthesis regulatory protein [Golovinomyces cichoracearum]|uniref:Glucan synthesis regulatory protein n=1 Tax=Golovinomyces cichoracearum TaxID=62708 RepID=A0A420HFL4_9PEZI|nr:Glucan synthesis regulatory protein [Golovinomyces cichoracearum]
MSFSSAFRSFWHAMTSYDRHSSYDSPYRTGQHVPLSQSRHDPLTSVATSESDSRHDVNTSYFDKRHTTSGPNGHAYSGSPPILSSSPAPHSPYLPGMRSNITLHKLNTTDNCGRVSPGEIQLQAFQEGLPPPPPVSHSWKRIDKWAEDNYQELWDQLCEGCTSNDLNELEHQLDFSLPMDVRESLQIHDGQERGGLPTGIIFGSMLLDCEEIVQEWENWKKVNREFLTEPVNYKHAVPVKALGGSSSSSKRSSSQATNPLWRQDLLARQDSQPHDAIKKVYAHPAWIPMVRDWGGNNLAVDLAPGPAGKWGQVILFGRDYDCKYVVSRSWSAFLSTVADDLNSGRWFVDEETNELKLREFKSTNVEPGYLDILRWRMDQKYGRRDIWRKNNTQSVLSLSVGSPSGSPYTSPTTDNAESRGRSMQRFSGASPVASPNRPNFTKSPLAKVAEESSQISKNPRNGDRQEKLVEIGNARPSEEEKENKILDSLLQPVSLFTDPKPTKTMQVKIGSVDESHRNGKISSLEDENMKTIVI